MRQLERQSRRAGREVVVISDNARYHHACLHAAWRDAVADHFRLSFLPPYTPELNPIERVWKLIRRGCLHNLVGQMLEVRHASVCRGLRRAGVKELLLTVSADFTG